MTENELSKIIVDVSYKIHTKLGPGLLESVYHKCLIEELNLKGIAHESEFKIPVIYKGKVLETDFRCDLIIENKIIVELKAIQEFHPFHEAQLLNYMQLTKIPKGILINFNCNNIFNEGQKTFVNEYYKKLPQG